MGRIRVQMLRLVSMLVLLAGHSWAPALGSFTLFTPTGQCPWVCLVALTSFGHALLLGVSPGLYGILSWPDP